MVTAGEVAQRVIHLARTEDKLVNELSPLKLQKLLFYIQGWYAANKEKRLFMEDIYAWQYGPVVPEVYDTYKDFGARDLKTEDTSSEVPENTELDDDIKSVLKVYGNMSAYELVSRTHKEEVWRKNYESSNKLMPFEDIKKAFWLKLQEIS